MIFKGWDRSLSSLPSCPPEQGSDPRSSGRARRGKRSWKRRLHFEALVLSCINQCTPRLDPNGPNQSMHISDHQSINALLSDDQNQNQRVIRENSEEYSESFTSRRDLSVRAFKTLKFVYIAFICVYKVQVIMFVYNTLLRRRS